MAVRKVAGIVAASSKDIAEGIFTARQLGVRAYLNLNQLK